MAKKQDATRTDTQLTSQEEAVKSSSQRGQLEPQHLLGAFVLILIGGSLVAAAGDLQDGLASSPAFSEFWAGIIALLFLLALVFGILGIE